MFHFKKIYFMNQNQTILMKKFMFFASILLCVTHIQVLEASTNEFGLAAVQQKKMATGKVIDQNGEPLPGATIIEKGVSGNGTIADMDGRFAFNVNASGVGKKLYLLCR